MGTDRTSDFCLSSLKTGKDVSSSTCEKDPEVPFTVPALVRGQDELQFDCNCSSSSDHQRGKMCCRCCFVVVLKAGNYSDDDPNICAKMRSNSILLNKLPSM